MKKIYNIWVLTKRRNIDGNKRKKYMDIISIFMIRISTRRITWRISFKDRLVMVAIIWTKFWAI